MASVKERATARVAALRKRYSLVDHLVRTFAHYSDRNGNAQAGAVTFFAFLSFFPILALAFWAVGLISEVFPDLRAEVVEVVEQALPGLVGSGNSQIQLWEIEKYASTVGWIGLLGVAYTGLGWVSGMRRALQVMFRLPREEQPSFVLGKLRDLLTLLLLGMVLLTSIGLTSGVTWFSGVILAWLDLDGSWPATAFIGVLAYGLGVLATTVLFLAMFRFLARPHVARRALWQGAVAGAIGFEVLKAVASQLIALTKESPAFLAFGVALILLVWINYFSRLVMLSASWAYTAPVAHEMRKLESEPLLSEEEAEDLVPAPAAVAAEDAAGLAPPRERLRRRRREQVGGASALAAAVVVALTWVSRRRHE
jgi:membrane protein